MDYDQGLPPGYMNLIRAVFDAACRDYIAVVCRHYNGGTRLSSRRHCSNIKNEARDWFMDDDKDSSWPFSLKNICHVLGWNEDVIRKAISEREAPGEKK